MNEEGKVREIGGDHAVDVGVLHLYRDVLAVLRDGAVHLGQRRGRDRHLVETREAVVEAASEARFDVRADCREGARWHAVVKLAEHVEKRGRKHIGAAAHELANFHQQALEPHGGVAKTTRGAQVLAVVPVASRAAAREAAMDLTNLVVRVDQHDEAGDDEKTAGAGR